MNSLVVCLHCGHSLTVAHSLTVTHSLSLTHSQCRVVHVVALNFTTHSCLRIRSYTALLDVVLSISTILELSVNDVDS